MLYNGTLRLKFPFFLGMAVGDMLYLRHLVCSRCFDSLWENYQQLIQITLVGKIQIISCNFMLLKFCHINFLFQGNCISCNSVFFFLLCIRPLHCRGLIYPRIKLRSYHQPYSYTLLKYAFYVPKQTCLIPTPWTIDLGSSNHMIESFCIFFKLYHLVHKIKGLLKKMEMIVLLLVRDSFP